MALKSSGIQVISVGGRQYIDQESLLDFLDKRAKLVVMDLRIHGTSLIGTEFLRGQSFEQENIKHAIESSKQSS